MKKEKEKLILSISIGCTALILTITLFIQFKTIYKTDITAIETMRETELREEISKWKEKYDEIEVKLNDTNNKIEQYNNQVLSDENSKVLLSEEYEENQMFLGYTDVQGEGIIITLSDTSYKTISSDDLINIVNELKIAGAEAISINDERIVNTTDIACIYEKMILVNGNRISSPYVVKAIGDKKYLESAMTIKNGFLDEMTISEKDNSYVTDDNIIIKKYSGEMTTKYLNENKEE